MTELTDDQVKTLLDGATPGPWTDRLPGEEGIVSTGDDLIPVAYYVAQKNRPLIASAPDIARALLDARAELARVKTDAATAMALRVEARENAMQALASMGQAQEAYEAQLEAEAELATLRAQVERLTRALRTIRDDRMTCPRAVDCVQIARAALAPTPTDPGDGWTTPEDIPDAP